jgi:hypothetical protein
MYPFIRKSPAASGLREPARTIASSITANAEIASESSRNAFARSIAPVGCDPTRAGALIELPAAAPAEMLDIAAKKKTDAKNAQHERR